MLGITLVSFAFLGSKPEADSGLTPSEEMARKINENPRSTWKAEASPYHQDFETRRKMFNLIIDEVGEEFDDAPDHGLQGVELPENFDPREAWPKCESIREIRDQSGCGSCWAFGASSAMSDRICVASKQKDQRRISSEDVLECCKGCGMGCNGGWLSPTWYNWKYFGFVTGSLYDNKDWCKSYKFPPCNHHSKGPYEDCSKYRFDSPKCEKSCSNSNYKKSYSQDKIKASKIYTVRSEEKIMQELMTNGPMETAFTVFEDFILYKSGVYQHQEGKFLGGHAVKMMGWGVEDGVKYWLIANSWNNSWGDNGYFKILRGKDHCGIEASVIGGLPQL